MPYLIPYFVQSAANVGNVVPATVGDCEVQMAEAARNFWAITVDSMFVAVTHVDVSNTEGTFLNFEMD